MKDQYRWSAVSNRANADSIRYINGDVLPWISNKGTWARCHHVNQTSPAYRAWTGLYSRLEKSDSNYASHPTYATVYACEEWHNYQAFAEWYYSQIGDYETYELDKDILKPRNSLYSPEFCGLVPSYLNKFFAFDYATNTVGFPGLTKRSLKSGERWLVRVQTKKIGRAYSKVHSNIDEAKEDYCREKELHAILLLDRLKQENIDNKYLEALDSFHVKDYIG